MKLIVAIYRCKPADLGVCWYVKIDDHIYMGNVQTSARDVCGNED